MMKLRSEARSGDGASEVGLPCSWSSFLGDARTGFLFGVRIGFGFEGGERRLSGSLWNAPFVGFLVGLWSLFFGLLIFWLTSSLWLGGLTLLGVMVLTTGGFHEDGLGDVFDGFGVKGWGGVEGREALWRHRQEVMKDSRVGAYGVMGLILLMSGRFFGVVESGLEGMVMGVLSVVPLSRVSMVLLLRFVPLAKAEGAAADAGFPTWGVVLVSLVLGLLPGLWFWGEGVLFLMCVFLVTVCVWGYMMRYCFGGITGDGCGGGVVVSECALWWTVVGMV